MTCDAHLAADGMSGATGMPVGECVSRSGWHLHAQAQVIDFAEYRRRLGRSRAEAICREIVGSLRHALPLARVAIVGRGLFEIDWTGDEPTMADQAEAVVRAALARPIDLGVEPIPLMLSAAVVVGRGEVDEVQLAEAAESVLASTRGINAAKPDRGTQALVDELRCAIEEDQLVLFYQPKVHARRQEIDSAEGLVRWQHPERGLVMPGDFIQVAEEGQLIDRLTLWTIQRAIRDQRVLLSAGHDLRLFINISGQLLADPVFVERACDLIVRSDAKIGFEVTETSVIRDPTTAIANLQRFADIGIRIAIDDYGAGLSSLAYLKQLPARELKIDKLFVTQLTSSNRDPLIVRSTIDLAHALDMEVVAEGVETHAALALLTVMGCDMVQGFLISRPIPRDALVTFLCEDRNRRASVETRLSFSKLANAWKRG